MSKVPILHSFERLLTNFVMFSVDTLWLQETWNLYLSCILLFLWQGQRLPPITQQGIPPWPDLQELIDHCTEQLPEDRPTVSPQSDLFMFITNLSLDITFFLVVVVVISSYCKEKAQAWYIHVHSIMVTNNPGPCSLAGTWPDTVYNLYYNHLTYKLLIRCYC